MRKLRPIRLIVIGLLLLVGGIVYDVLFAGIPYQDVPQELLNRYALHRKISSILCLAGFSTFLAGAIWSAFCLLHRKRDAPTSG